MSKLIIPFLFLLTFFLSACGQALNDSGGGSDLEIERIAARGGGS